MIKSFESVYKETEDLFINKLPDYIEKVNKKHNDCLILQSFVNTRLEEKCTLRPSFVFEYKQTEYTEKDRIIKASKFNINITLQLHVQSGDKRVAIFWRYVEAISMMLDEHESSLNFDIENVLDNTIQINIFNEE